MLLRLPGLRPDLNKPLETRPRSIREHHNPDRSRWQASPSSPTTLPHHYQQSTAQKKQQSRGKPLVFLESDAVIERGLRDAGFFLGCWGGKIQSSPLSCSDRSRLVLSKTR